MGIYTPNNYKGIKSPNFKKDAPQRLERPLSSKAKWSRARMEWPLQSREGRSKAGSNRSKLSTNLNSLGEILSGSLHSRQFFTWLHIWSRSLQALERPSLIDIALPPCFQHWPCLNGGLYMPLFASFGLLGHHGMSSPLGIGSATPEKARTTYQSNQ